MPRAHLNKSNYLQPLCPQYWLRLVWPHPSMLGRCCWPSTRATKPCAPYPSSAMGVGLAQDAALLPPSLDCPQTNIKLVGWGPREGQEPVQLPSRALSSQMADTGFSSQPSQCLNRALGK